jgi:hypothetical protein
LVKRRRHLGVCPQAGGPLFAFTMFQPAAATTNRWLWVCCVVRACVVRAWLVAAVHCHSASFCLGTANPCTHCLLLFATSPPPLSFPCRRMPPGHRQYFCLDMAHLSDGPSSLATSIAAGTDADGRSLADLSVHMVSRDPESGAAGHARDSAGSIHSKTGKAAAVSSVGGDRSRRGGSRHGGAGVAGADSGGSRHGASLYAAGGGGGSRHGGNAYGSAGGSRHGGNAYSGAGDGSRHGGSRRGGSAHAAAIMQQQSARGDGSRHGGRGVSGDASGSVHVAAPPSSVASLGGLEGLGSLVGSDVAGDLDQTCEVPSTVASHMFRKTLNLQRSQSGLVVASYMLEPSAHGGSVFSAGTRGDASPH